MYSIQGGYISLIKLTGPEFDISLLLQCWSKTEALRVEAQCGDYGNNTKAFGEWLQKISREIMGPCQSWYTHSPTGVFCAYNPVLLNRDVREYNSMFDKACVVDRLQCSRRILPIGRNRSTNDRGCLALRGTEPNFDYDSNRFACVDIKRWGL